MTSEDRAAPRTRAGREMAGVIGDTPVHLEWANFRIRRIEQEAVGDRRGALVLREALERLDAAARLVVQSQRVGQRKRAVALEVALTELESAIGQSARALLADPAVPPVGPPE